ncbi:choice-of-anchor M domain-containing protein [Arcanobacterium ihumii]|uniref:choice-of-anchor M domain-containing protein n=1 Tax=Arcanobacterium ihumii TaxID=2138162 RepID=UPI000F51FD63|nr:choice-of-anchor M domain-containing protein [Arcanobacterium ihumii]
MHKFGSFGWKRNVAALNNQSRNAALSSQSSLVTGIFFVALSLIFATLVALPAQAASSYTVLTTGHTDAITVVPNGGTVSLVTKEDITTPGKSTYHNPNEVIFGVADASYNEQTKQLPEIGIAGYALPQVQDQRLLWPGFDSLKVGEIDPAKIEFEFISVKGPGKVFMWQQGVFGGAESVLSGGAFDLRDGLRLTHQNPTHQHVNWLFSARGGYDFTVRAHVTYKDGAEIVSEPAVYHWVVGDDLIAQAKAGNYTPSTTVVNPGNPSLPSPGSNTTPSEVTQPAPSASPTPQSATQNSQPQAEQCIPTEVKTPIAAPSAGATRTGGSYTIPANTHVHPNWVFSAPGTYRVSITQSTTSKSGQALTTSGVLTFNVGGTGNANSGHFDVGTVSNGGGITMSIKDDRSQPANWVSPSSLVFGVANSAKTTAPAGIEFVAPAGSPIWLISSTQVPGVPWVGANTMHPSLLQNTSGNVTWTLNSVSGPGSLAVFESGNFGKIVGRYWFGGSSSSSQMPSGVVKENGQYYRIEYVGKTASGADCQLSAEQIAALRAQGKNIAASALPGNLSTTGSSLVPAIIAAVVVIFSGVVFVLYRRRRSDTSARVSTK